MAGLRVLIALLVVCAACAHADSDHTVRMPAAPTPAHGQSKPVPKVVVDLDAPAKERWTHVAATYKDPITYVVNTVKNSLPPGVFDLLAKLMASLDDLLGANFADELRGIANATGLPLGDIVIMNLYYELDSGCTSILAQNKEGQILHGRNLDYGIAGLQNMTVDVSLQRKGVEAYRMVTYAGYVGSLTGMRPGVFSVSIDERDLKGDPQWHNVFAAIFDGAVPVALFVRSQLETALGFEDAVEALSNVPLISTEYIIVGGARFGEGAIITRDRPHAADVWRLQMPERWFILETNYDHWNAPPADDDRRDPANKMMNTSSVAKVTLDHLDQVLTTFPVLNSMTTYTALMCAACKTLEAKTQNA